MTRQDITQQAKDKLGEYQGDEQSGSPFAWASLVTSAANQVARKTYCLYAAATLDLVANQSQYGAPSYGTMTQVELFQINAVTCLDSNSVQHTLAEATVAYMDDAYPTWRTETASTQPRIWINLGANAFVLYNVPSYSLAAGLTMEGYAVPGKTWEALTAECPLPGRTHDAIILKACLNRIIQNPTQANMMRVSMLREEYQSQLNDLENEVRNWSQATRSPAYIGENGYGNSPNFNPLNQ